MATPPLPATAWASSMDYLPYKDVRSNLQISRMFAKEVSKHVETISILRPCEMDIPAARRFANAKRIKILCVIQFETDEDNFIEHTFVNEAAMGRTVPFLLVFPKITHIFVGGWFSSESHSSEYNGCKLYDVGTSATTRDDTFFLNFMASICDALLSRALSRAQLHDIQFVHRDDDNSEPQSALCPSHDNQSEQANEYECRFCRSAFEVFPLHRALMMPCRCTAMADRMVLLYNRPGGREFLSRPSLLQDLMQQLPRFRSFREVHSVNADLVLSRARRARRTGSVSNYHLPFLESSLRIVNYIEKTSLERIFELVNIAGNDPRQVDMNRVGRCWLARYTDLTPFIQVPGQLISFLGDIGFQVDALPDENEGFIHVIPEGSDARLDEHMTSTFAWFDHIPN